jgi:hypothetical protein
MSLVLECKETSDFKPHPEGIHPAICLDVIDLGMVKTEYQGEHRIVPKLKLVFESEQKTDDGRNCTISKNFTASLHPKARLAEFLGKWRGRPVLPGESIDLGKLIGVCCTLVISHQQNFAGKTYASIDAISKPTKKLNASGGYDPAAARQRIAEWQAKQAVAPAATMPAPSAAARSAIPPVPQRPVPSKSSAVAAPPRATAAVEDDISFDPEVGF